MNNRRQYVRVPFHEAVAYQKGVNLPQSGSIGNDLSQGGVQVRVQEFIPLQSVIDLNIHFSNPARSVPVKGKVVWVREVPFSDAFDVGISFVDDPYNLQAIESYIRSRRFEA